MIRTQEMVPDWYIEKSRDFQILCRLYDYTLNGLKYNIETMQSLTDTRSVKDNVLPLVGDKFGIYNKDAYTNRHLLEAFPIASKYKGSLKAINILLNAFLDSMDIFDYAVIFHSRDAKSAAEIAQILGRDVKPYSLNIVFSSFPSLTNLSVLNEYVNKVAPSGFIMEYGFGISKEIVDSFNAKEYTYLLYTHKQEYEDGKLFPYIGFVKGKEDKYSGDNTEAQYEAAFEIIDITQIRTIKELVEETVAEYTPKYRPVPVPPSTSIIAQYIVEGALTEPLNITTDNKLVRATGESIYAGAYIRYSYSGTAEFIKETLSNVDVNAISIATVVGGEDE